MSIYSKLGVEEVADSRGDKTLSFKKLGDVGSRREVRCEITKRMITILCGGKHRAGALTRLGGGWGNGFTKETSALFS